MKVGLYFGSFNPVHIGHMAIANYLVQFTELDEVWFVVSPQNPFKERKNLLADYHRYEMLNRAIDGFKGLKVSSIEFTMPKPSYTADTLARLVEKYPSFEFSLIMGEDNLLSFHKWKNYEIILQYHDIYVYPRPKHDGKCLDPVILNKTHWVAAPLIEISSSFIRAAIASGKNIKYFMPHSSFVYLQEMNFFKQAKSS